MKKLLTYLIIACILMPLSVHATKIVNETVSGPKEAIEKEEITLSFNIDFDDLDKSSKNTKGIMAIAFNIKFSDDVLLPVELSKEFASTITKSGNYYTITSAIKEGMTNTCQDGLLYCGNYKIDVKFYVKDTNIQKLDVSIEDIIVAVYESGLIDEETLDDDKVELLTKTSKVSYTINIEKPKTDNSSTEPSSIAAEKELEDLKKTIKDNVSKKDIKPSAIDEKKSNNNYLKSLYIESYEIVFDKNTSIYTIKLNDDVNSLNVTAELEDNKAKYEIQGAEDLKANDNQVKIIVTAEDESKRAYIITTTTAKETTTKKEEMVELFGYKIEKKYLKYAAILLIVLVCFFIIKGLSMLLADKIGNRKINRALKELDKK
ncbi:MAG TPA: hypothetical protein DCY94_01930 [Firmicutes bacterium]|nr:hypothetical protein [Bacillota bacterium]